MAGTATRVALASAPAWGLWAGACSRQPVSSDPPVLHSFLNPTHCLQDCCYRKGFSHYKSQPAGQGKQRTCGAPQTDKFGLNYSSLPYPQIETLHVIGVFVRSLALPPITSLCLIVQNVIRLFLSSGTWYQLSPPH